MGFAKEETNRQSDGQSLRIKKAVFFDPYLDTLGGGERYFLTLASFLESHGWQVDIYGFSQAIAKKINHRFNLDVKRVNFLNVNLSKIKLLKRIDLLRKYDLSFYISDGSIPWLWARKNILHFQVPFVNVGGRSLVNQIKLAKINQIVCNSYFTKRFIDREYKVKSLVIHPPVSIETSGPTGKENLIVNVGRFTNLLHKKRQDVLVNAFKELWSYKRNQSWRLILAGSDKEGKELVSQLKKASRGYPIGIQTNLNYAAIKNLYQRAKIFWSAAGYGIDERTQPWNVEHFGISTVEAMAAGCVPVVIAKGGQKEIISHKIDGFLWQTPSELIKVTQKLIDNHRLWGSVSQSALKKSQQFSQKNFTQSYEKIISA